MTTTQCFQNLLTSSDYITLVYKVKDFRKRKITTKEGKTLILQDTAFIGVSMSKKEFKRRRLKAQNYYNSTFISNRTIIVRNNTAEKVSLCKQGWIKLGLIPEPDFLIKVPLKNTEKTFDIPVVESSNKALSFLNKEERNILSDLIGKTLICTGRDNKGILHFETK